MLHALSTDAQLQVQIPNTTMTTEGQNYFLQILFRWPRHCQDKKLFYNKNGRFFYTSHDMRNIHQENLIRVQASQVNQG